MLLFEIPTVIAIVTRSMRGADIKYNRVEEQVYTIVRLLMNVAPSCKNTKNITSTVDRSYFLTSLDLRDIFWQQY